MATGQDTGSMAAKHLGVPPLNGTRCVFLWDKRALPFVMER